MILNYNGQLVASEAICLSHRNRAFKFGDALFETLKVSNGVIHFWEDHYFRLMASMRMLRMEIPLVFTLEYLENEILKTCTDQSMHTNYRVRITVYRKDGGMYNPITNEVDFLIESSESNYETKEKYEVDLFKDFHQFSGGLSTVKTSNKILNTLASIHANENKLDNCLLLNERKSIVEATNANIFIVTKNCIKTPSVKEGCVKGIIRKRLLEMIQEKPNWTLEEGEVSPFDMQKADEVFLTNSIIGIQSVTKYRRVLYKTKVGEELAQMLEKLT